MAMPGETTSPASGAPGERSGRPQGFAAPAGSSGQPGREEFFSRDLSGQNIGKYKLLERLAPGGMAVVYKARDEELDREVALKILNPVYGADPTWQKRFRREVRAMARLAVPHCAQVYDSGSDRGYLFVVEELLEAPVSSKLRPGEALPETTALRWVYQAALGLADAHSRHIVHGDIKPRNLMLTPDQRILKIVDFGLARLLDQTTSVTASVAGTPLYISPEQCGGAADVTGKADIYSLGVTLFEMLTGQHPATGSASEVVAKHLAGSLREITDLNKGLRPETVALYRTMVDRDPNNRPTAEEVAKTIYGILSEIGDTETLVGLPPPPQPAPAPRPWFSLPPINVQFSLRVALGAVLLAGLGALSWLTVCRQGEPGDIRFVQAYFHGHSARDGKWESFILKEGQPLSSGDQYRVVFQPDQDCYIYLVNMDAAGNVYGLYPPAGQPSLTSGGRVCEAPGGTEWFTLDQTVGEETLYLVAARRPLAELEALLKKASQPPAEPQVANELAAVFAVLDVAAGDVADGQRITLRGAKAEPDRRVGMAELRADPVLDKPMTGVQNAVASVKRVRFKHEAKP